MKTLEDMKEPFEGTLLELHDEVEKEGALHPLWRIFGERHVAAWWGPVLKKMMFGEEDMLDEETFRAALKDMEELAHRLRGASAALDDRNSYLWSVANVAANTVYELSICVNAAKGDMRRVPECWKEWREDEP